MNRIVNTIIAVLILAAVFRLAWEVVREKAIVIEPNGCEVCADVNDFIDYTYVDTNAMPTANCNDAIWIFDVNENSPAWQLEVSVDSNGVFQVEYGEGVTQSEAAKAFFDEYVKPMCDDYIKSRLS